MTRAEFEAAVERMRQAGEVSIKDYPGGGELRLAPYRYATLSVVCTPAEAGHEANRMIGVAVAVRGYMTVQTPNELTPERVSIDVSVSRPLEAGRHESRGAVVIAPVLDKVRKLLELAKSANEHEAATAAARAAELMLKHQIEEADLEAVKPAGEHRIDPAGHEVIDRGGRQLAEGRRQLR